jgi:hypothetical protein
MQLYFLKRTCAVQRAMSALGPIADILQMSLNRRLFAKNWRETAWKHSGCKPVAKDIDIWTTDVGGHEIRGTYRVSGQNLLVTLSDGSSTETQFATCAMPADTFAKLLLRELDRKRREAG